jgi:hypothetical protein
MNRDTRVARNRDDRQPSIYRVGDRVDVAIHDAEVVEVGIRQRDLIVRLAGDEDCPDELRVPLGHHDVHVVLRVPADGPIRVGDVWRDRYGERWFAIAAPNGDPRMVAQRDGRTQTPEWLARHHSPLTLDYRPDSEPAVDERVPCGATSFSAPHPYERDDRPLMTRGEYDEYEHCGKLLGDPIHQLDEDVEGGDDRG